jgi:hypothetical protein
MTKSMKESYICLSHTLFKFIAIMLVRRHLCAHTSLALCRSPNLGIMAEQQDK